MDQNKEKPANLGDNSNAPGTYPNGTSSHNVLDSLPARIGEDPKAPVAGDPLNGGISRFDATTEPTAAIELEIGGTGTIIVGGILVDSDYNPDLAGRKRIEVYDKMRKGDATIRLGLSATKLPLLSADWYIKPGEGEDENGEKVQFLKQELFQNPNFGFTQFQREALLYCDYGSMYFEKIFRMRADGKVGWKNFASRLPKTIYRYTLQDGFTPGLTQYLPTGGMAQIPQWKLLSFILDLEGSNYEGISLLRACYMHWYYKDLLYRIDAIASERQGMGVPIIRVPSQATPEDKRRAKEVARNLRVNEQAYVDLPDGFTLEYIDTHSQTLKNVEAMVMHHDRQILKGFNSHFLDMGAKSAGSHNLSEDQSDLYYLGEWYLAKVFKTPVNMAARELVAMNWSGLKPEQYPTLEHGFIGKPDFAGMADAINKYTTSGVIIPDDQLERHVRKSMHLPEAEDVSKMDDDQKARRKIGTPQPDPLELAKAKFSGGGGGFPPKGAPAKPKKYVNAEDMDQAFEFAESFLGMKDALEEIVANKEHAEY